MTKLEKYFVICFDGESPAEIHFSHITAFATQARYIDSFDDYGKSVTAYKAIYENGVFVGYTTDF